MSPFALAGIRYLNDAGVYRATLAGGKDAANPRALKQFILGDGRPGDLPPSGPLAVGLTPLEILELRPNDFRVGYS